MDIKPFQNGHNGKNPLYIIDNMETYIGTTKIKKEKFGIKGIYSQKQVHNTSGKQNKL